MDQTFARRRELGLVGHQAHSQSFMGDQFDNQIQELMEMIQKQESELTYLRNKASNLSRSQNASQISQASYPSQSPQYSPTLDYNTWQRQKQNQERIKHLEALRAEESMASRLEQERRNTYKRDLDNQVGIKHEKKLYDMTSGEAQYRDEIDKLMSKSPDYPTMPNQYFTYGPKAALNENIRYSKNLRRTLTFDPIIGQTRDTNKYGSGALYY